MRVLSNFKMATHAGSSKLHGSQTAAFNQKTAPILSGYMVESFFCEVAWKAAPFLEQTFVRWLGKWFPT